MNNFPLGAILRSAACMWIVGNSCDGIFGLFYSNWLFPEMRTFSKSASAKKLRDGWRHSCSATFPKWPFSVIIVFIFLLIFEVWKLGSFDTHYMQGSGSFFRLILYKFLPWRKHFIKWMWCCSFLVQWHFANNLIWKSKRKSSKMFPRRRTLNARWIIEPRRTLDFSQ